MTRQTRTAKAIVAVVLFVGLMLASTGCDQELLGEVAALSATYAGGVVEAATGYLLENRWNVGGEDEGDSTALHEHEH
jgi:hypothetical protein